MSSTFPRQQFEVAYADGAVWVSGYTERDSHTGGRADPGGADSASVTLLPAWRRHQAS